MVGTNPAGQAKVALNLCSISAPWDPRVWSGTPFNIEKELKRQRLHARSFRVGLPHPLYRFLYLLQRPFVGEADLAERMPFGRQICSLRSILATKRSNSCHTLHLGGFSLPFFYCPKNQHHYLYCDTTWNLWSQQITGSRNLSSRARWVFENLERKTYAQVRHIFVTSEYVRHNLVDHYSIPEDKITPVGTGLGVIKPFFGNKILGGKSVLFTAKGRFKDKGGELVLEVLSKARSIDPDIRLTIVGCQDAQRFSDHPGVTAFGFVPQNQLQEMFNTHNLFLMPALNEPWGLVYLEAMVCRMPIMGLNRNSFPEISNFGQFGFGIDRPDPDTLAQKLVEVFRDPEYLMNMGNQAQEWCLRHFTWEQTVRRIVEVVEKKGGTE